MGTLDIPKLVAECAQWQKAKKNLSALSILPPQKKRSLVYPEIIKLAVRLFTGEKDPGYALKIYTEFLLAELAVEPDLAGQLLSRSRIGDGGLAALAASSVFDNLESLRVSDSLTDKDLFALASSKRLAKLHRVSIAPWGNKLFTQEGVDALQARFREVTVLPY